jgi:hypothetical protein
MNAKYREESLTDKMMGLSNEGHEILNFVCKDNEAGKYLHSFTLEHGWFGFSEKFHSTNILVSM